MERIQKPSAAGRAVKSKSSGKLAQAASLADRILALMQKPGYQGLDKVDLSKELGIESADRTKLRKVLHAMEHDGAIVRIRKNRFVLPQAAQLVTGRIEFHRNGSAHVVNEAAGGVDVFVAGQNTDVALHGDRVVARLMDEREQAGGQREAVVIRILARGTQRVVGILKRTAKCHYVAPDDPRIPQDVIVEPSPAARVGDKVVVRLDAWESRQLNPEGTIVEVLGPPNAPGVDIIGIIRKHDLPESFPDAVLEEADRIPEQIDAAEITRREDCRHLPIVTIDPDDAKDFDDAILVERTANGWSLQVHIADVSHYVFPGSALDQEARTRGNSTYLVDRVIPMLPERLSNGICSLKPKVDRLTYAAFIDFDEHGKPRRSRFARAVIRSVHRFTYKQAFAQLQGEDGPHAERLRLAWSLASLLRRNRFAGGSLDLDFPEVKVRLDEQGRVARLEKIENDISHQLIEEFMLAANEAVARVLKTQQVPTIYRVHEKPDPDRLAEFREIVRTYGYRMGDPQLREEIQRVLAASRGKPEEPAVRIALLRRLMRARYDTTPLGHYGLAKVNYTHFTSPIRRYADLVVHRSLAALPQQRSGDGKHRQAPAAKVRAPAMRDLGQIADHISATERTSADAENESVQMKKMDYFQRQLDSRRPEAFRAVVTDVRSFGLLIELPDVMQSGAIPVSAMGNDFFQFDPVRRTFYSRRQKKRYALGDTLKVIVARVNPMKRQIDFAPI